MQYVGYITDLSDKACTEATSHNNFPIQRTHIHSFILVEGLPFQEVGVIIWHALCAFCLLSVFFWRRGWYSRKILIVAENTGKNNNASGYWKKEIACHKHDIVARCLSLEKSSLIYSFKIKNVWFCSCSWKKCLISKQNTATSPRFPSSVLYRLNSESVYVYL